MIAAEIEADNVKVDDLATERGLKTARNVAGGAGIVVWPLFSAWTPRAPPRLK